MKVTVLYTLLFRRSDNMKQSIKQWQSLSFKSTPTKLMLRPCSGTTLASHSACIYIRLHTFWRKSWQWARESRNPNFWRALLARTDVRRLGLTGTRKYSVRSHWSYAMPCKAIPVLSHKHVRSFTLGTEVKGELYAPAALLAEKIPNTLSCSEQGGGGLCRK